MKMIVGVLIGVGLALLGLIAFYNFIIFPISKR